MLNMIGRNLGRYHILEQIGEGGMAIVYKAFDTRLETDVAVKVIRTDQLAPAILERALKRFEREAKALARLTHANIVNVSDYGEEEGLPYLVMPYLPGGTLKEKLRGEGKISWQDATRLLLPVAKALAYAHDEEMIHRDVKPANILITRSGDPMLTDFGIAKIIDEKATMDLTGTRATVGTPEYMAPEQVTAKTVDHRADIYALGVVLYEMVTGRKPFQADTPMAVLVKLSSEPLPRPTEFTPKLPEEIERVLLKALAKDPANRYQSMREFVMALERLVAGKVPTADLVGTKQWTPRFGNRSLAFWIVLGIVGISLIGVLVSFFSNQGFTGYNPLNLPISPFPQKVIQATATTNAPFETLIPYTPANQKNLLEDHFDTQQYDGSYNGLLWNCGNCTPELVFQKDGIFQINVTSSPESTSSGLRSLNSWTYNNIAYIEAKLKLENYDGSRHADVNMQLWADFQGYQWWTSCQVYFEPNSPGQGYFSCHDGRLFPNGTSKGDFSTSYIPVNAKEWQLARIEIEPKTFRLNFYLNGELIGTRIPADADSLKSKDLTPIFSIWTEGMSSFIASLDDLVVGGR